MYRVGISILARALFAVGAVVLAAAVAGELLGADEFSAYPTIEVGLFAATVALTLLVAASGLAPWRRSG